MLTGVLSATFTIVNQCEQTVWGGILSNADSPQLSSTAFVLQKGGSKTISLPSSWGVRFWGRTHCTQDSTGKFSCITDDCGSGKLECGGGASSPATVVEFKLSCNGRLNYYGVSFVHGYNLALKVVPRGCTAADYIITSCPSSPQLSSTGFVLQKGGSKTISLPSSRGGSFWGRTHCTQDFTGKFSRITGDCGSEKLECGGGGGASPPSTVAEFKLICNGDLDYYGVSFVHGYNLALRSFPGVVPLRITSLPSAPLHQVAQTR